MSYILDALRRADAERERGTVPGLNAQPVAPAPAQGTPLRAPLLAGGAVALLALAGVLAWAAFGGRREAPPPLVLASAAPAAPAAVVAPVAPAVVTAPADPPPVAPASIAIPPPGRVVTSPPARVAAPLPVPAPSPATAPVPRRVAPAASAADAAPAPPSGRVPTPRTPPRSTALSVQAPDAARVPSEPGLLPATPSTRTPPLPAAPQASPSAAGEAPVVALAQLPDSVRRELPALSFGGAMYSPTPSGRMLVVNGQLQREGDQLGPELWLERIQLKDAVLRYKGHRFSVSY